MPYAWRADDVRSALDDAGLEMVSLNTRIGDQPGDLGVAAVPGREVLARSYIDEALEYANSIGCPQVSVVAGKTGQSAEAEVTYRENLSYAARQAATIGKTILIEPLNTGVAPDYHLTRVDDGVVTLDAVGADNLKLMVDCFHTHIMEDDLAAAIRRVIDHIGHVQFAALPDRGEPDSGLVDYHDLLPAIAAWGYRGPFGAEYTPRGEIDAGLAWLQSWHATREA